MSKYSGKQFSNEDVLNFAKTDGADIAGTVSLPKMSGNNITINGTENGGKLLSGMKMEVYQLNLTLMLVAE